MTGPAALLIVLVVTVLVTKLWKKRFPQEKRKPARRERRTPGRRAAMTAVIVLLGTQAVLTAPAASAAECGAAPNPERPGAGMVGALDPPRGRGEPNSAYIDYSYAGMVWYVYETKCGPLSGITDPNSTIDTWGGNQLFNMGKNIVGATNALHYTVMERGLLSPLYNAVKSGAEKVYNNIYAQLFGLAALILAIMMFRSIWRGDLSAVSKRALYAMAGIWLAASSLALLRYYDDIDDLIVRTTAGIQAGFVDDTDNRIVRDVLPTSLHTQVVYNNWLRGEFGSPDDAKAQQFGRQLLDAQAFTWGQVRNGDDANQAVVDAKKAAYKNISTQLGPATGYFTGEDGSRTGAGFLAFAQSLVYSLFQLFAKAAVLLAQVLVRLFTLTAPLIGLVALLHHDILRRVAKVAGAVVFNLVVLSVLAGVHALLLEAIFAAGSSLSMLTQMVIAGLVTVLLFLVGRPVRRLWQMVEMSVGMVGSAVPTPKGGLFSRFRKQDTETPQDEFWRNVRDNDGGDAESRGPIGATVGGRRVRPEASGTVFATAQRLDQSGPARPAAAWSGASWPGPQSFPGGTQAALPAASNGIGTVPGHRPVGGLPGGTMPLRADGTSSGGSRTVDSPVITPPPMGRPGEPEPMVVPSRMGSVGTQQPDTGAAPVPPAPPRPRRAETEIVGGKQVHVVYRPSRGLEVRPDLRDGRDTDAVVR